MKKVQYEKEVLAKRREEAQRDKEDMQKKKAEKKAPFKRLNKPIDVAKILAFLCSDESGIMTGSIVDFDQTIAGWHSYSAYDTNILDDSLLGE